MTQDKLTYEEMVDVVCKLGAHLERLETLVIAFWEASKEQDEFLNTELIRYNIKNDILNKKTPYKRVLDLEEQFSGLVKFVNLKKFPTDKVKRIDKYK